MIASSPASRCPSARPSNVLAAQDEPSDEVHPHRGERWYVVETNPRQEALAVDHLSRQRFHGFCPRFRTVRSHARKREQVLAPLFPGYVFVRFDVERHPWRSINGTLGVRRLVGAEGNRPQAMPASVMQRILSRCEGGVVKHVLDAPQAGQAVRILSGPFADSLAAIETLDEQGRVSVLLDILGGQTAVRLPIGNLAPAWENISGR